MSAAAHPALTNPAWASTVKPGGPTPPGVTRVVRHNRRTSLTASTVARMPVHWGLRRAHPGTGMLTLAAPADPWRYPAHVTDGDGAAGIRSARSAVTCANRG